MWNELSPHATHNFTASPPKIGYLLFIIGNGIVFFFFFYAFSGASMYSMNGKFFVFCIFF